MFDPSPAQAVAPRVRPDHGLTRRDGTRCPRHGPCQGVMPSVHGPLPSEADPVSVGGSLCTPGLHGSPGINKLNTLILGQPPSTTYQRRPASSFGRAVDIVVKLVGEVWR